MNLCILDNGTEIFVWSGTEWSLWGPWRGLCKFNLSPGLSSDCKFEKWWLPLRNSFSPLWFTPRLADSKQERSFLTGSQVSLRICFRGREQARLALMSSSVNFKWLLTFELWVVRCEVYLEVTYPLNFSWNHPWPFLTHIISSCFPEVLPEVPL